MFKSIANIFSTDGEGVGDNVDGRSVHIFVMGPAWTKKDDLMSLFFA